MPLSTYFSEYIFQVLAFQTPTFIPYYGTGNKDSAGWPSGGEPPKFGEGAKKTYVAAFAGQENINLGSEFAGADVQLVIGTATGSTKALFYGWSPTNGIGLISQQGGITFNVDIWDETVTPSFSSNVTSIGTFYANNSLGSASTYVQQGVFIGAGFNDGTAQRFNSQQSEAWIEYSYTPPSSAPEIVKFAPFTGFDTGQTPQGALFYSKRNNKGNNFYINNGNVTNQVLSTNNSNGDGWESPLVVETDPSEQGFLAISTNIEESGVILYYNDGQQEVNNQTASVLELPESTSTDTQFVEQLFYLNANDRTSALVSTAAADATTGGKNIFNRQLRFYSSFEDPSSNAFNADFISTEELVQDYSGGIGYANYYDTFVAYRDDGNYFEWQYPTGGSVLDGQFVNIGDFSKDIDFYGDLLYATPSIDGSGIFFGYESGALQFYNGTYSYYIPEPTPNGVLSNLIPYDEKSIATIVYDENLVSNTGQNTINLNTYTDDEVSTISFDAPLSINGTKYKRAIEGTPGKDSIIGSRRNDFFNSNSEKSRDEIIGNGGRDTYLFTKSDLLAPENVGQKGIVTITDFGADDTIAISRHAVAYQKDVSLKTVSSNKGIRKATEKGFNIIYNEKNGKLFFNDGLISGEENDTTLVAILGNPEFGFSDRNLSVI